MKSQIVMSMQACGPFEERRGVASNEPSRAPVHPDRIAATSGQARSLADRDFFRSSPYRTARIRRAFEGETFGLPGVKATHVLVVQSQPGVRTRHALSPDLIGIKNLDAWPCSETASLALMAHVKKSSPSGSFELADAARTLALMSTFGESEVKA